MRKRHHVTDLRCAMRLFLDQMRLPCSTTRSSLKNGSLRARSHWIRSVPHSSSSFSRDQGSPPLITLKTSVVPLTQFLKSLCSRRTLSEAQVRTIPLSNHLPFCHPESNSALQLRALLSHASHHSFKHTPFPTSVASVVALQVVLSAGLLLVAPKQVCCPDLFLLLHVSISTHAFCHRAVFVWIAYGLVVVLNRVTPGEPIREHKRIGQTCITLTG